MILEIILVVIVCVLSFLFYRQDRTIKSQIDYIERIEQKFLMNYESISEGPRVALSLFWLNYC